MQFGIIAAGEGSRLQSEGIAEPKPLVSICGEKLIDRLIRIFADNGAKEISIICNGLTEVVKDHLIKIDRNGYLGRKPKINLSIKTTPSSMHSLHELTKTFKKDEPFVVTTVDTVFDEDRFSDYIDVLEHDISNNSVDGVMDVTRHIDDEKPLYVGVDNDNVITGFFDDAKSNFISAGVYGLNPDAYATLDRAIARGESRMRNYQRALITDGLRLKAFDLGMVLDIDHASDIVKAEKLLR